LPLRGVEWSVLAAADSLSMVSRKPDRERPESSQLPTAGSVFIAMQRIKLTLPDALSLLTYMSSAR